MDRKIALIFPGQGAQYIGMGKDFYDAFPLFKETFQEAEEYLEMHISDVLFQGPEEELKKTLHSQLGIFINSVAIYRVVKSQMPSLTVDTCSGLSLGEYSALYASGCMPFQEGLLLVKKRATFMTEACQKHPGTMAAVLGLDGAIVQEVIDAMSPGAQVWAANFNTPGQVVISGTQKGVAKASEEMKARGAKRVIPLQVEGAFHSGLMQEAQDQLTPYIDAWKIEKATTRLVMNVLGDYVEDSLEMKKNLIHQVTHSTRWEASIRNMSQAGITTFLELGCGKTLTTMNKKMVPEKISLSIDKLQDLEQLSTL